MAGFCGHHSEMDGPTREVQGLPDHILHSQRPGRHRAPTSIPRFMQGAQAQRYPAACLGPALSDLSPEPGKAGQEVRGHALDPGGIRRCPGLPRGAHGPPPASETLLRCADHLCSRFSQVGPCPPGQLPVFYKARLRGAERRAITRVQSNYLRAQLLWGLGAERRVPGQGSAALGCASGALDGWQRALWLWPLGWDGGTGEETSPCRPSHSLPLSAAHRRRQGFR